MLVSFAANAQWSLTGNAGTDPTVNFIGTTDAKAFKIKTNNVVRFYANATGNVGIGNSAPAAKLDVTGVIKATGGSSTDWNSAFAWGDHSLAGYLKTESDPEVGANTLNYLSKWNGSALSTSNLYSSGNFLGLNTGSSIGSAQFVVSSPNSGYGGIYVNTTGTAGLPFYGYANNGASNCWTYCDQATSTWTVFNNADRFSVESDGDVRIGQSVATSSRLDILGNSANTNPTVNIGSNYTGNVDVRALNATSVAAPGYGYGVFGTGGYMGLRGDANASTYTGSSYGVYGSASGSAGTRIGVYGYATNSGGSAFAGYFNGNTYASAMMVGTTTPATGYALTVSGKLIATEVRVQLTPFPDYVFDDSYNLKSIEQFESSIKTEKHLPGMPTACEVETDGLDMGQIQGKIVEKVEEQALYIIQLNNKIKELEQKIDQLSANTSKK